MTLAQVIVGILLCAAAATAQISYVKFNSIENRRDYSLLASTLEAYELAWNMYRVTHTTYTGSCEFTNPVTSQCERTRLVVNNNGWLPADSSWQNNLNDYLGTISLDGLLSDMGTVAYAIGSPRAYLCIPLNSVSEDDRDVIAGVNDHFWPDKFVPSAACGDMTEVSSASPSLAALNFVFEERSILKW